MNPDSNIAENFYPKNAVEGCQAPSIELGTGFDTPKGRSTSLDTATPTRDERSITELETTPFVLSSELAPSPTGVTSDLAAVFCCLVDWLAVSSRGLGRG
jgi:hypothetical protein